MLKIKNSTPSIRITNTVSKIIVKESAPSVKIKNE